MHCSSSPQRSQSSKLVCGDKYPNALHWEFKAAICEHIEAHHPELHSRTSLIFVGAYSSNAFFCPWPDTGTSAFVARLPIPQATRCPVIDPTGPSMGAFVRALVEYEPAGMKLFAYDEDLTFADAFEAWKRVTGEDYDVVEASLSDTYASTGIPLEVLGVPAFLAEHHFMAGVDGAIEPSQLRKKVQTQSFEAYLRTLSVEESLPAPRGEEVTHFTR